MCSMYSVQFISELSVFLSLLFVIYVFNSAKFMHKNTFILNNVIKFENDIIILIYTFIINTIKYRNI